MNVPSVSKTYSCKFKLEDRTYIVQVGIKAPSNDWQRYRDEIGSIVKHAINQEGFIKESNKNISIDCTQPEITYSLAGRVKKFSVNDPLPLNPTLSINELQKSILSKRPRTFQEIKASLLQWLPVRIPIVSFFWSILVYPLAQMTKWICPGKVLDLSSLELKADPHHQMSLEDALAEVIEILESSLDVRSKDALNAFQDGLKLTKQWRGVDYKSKQVVIEQLAQRLTSSETLKASKTAQSLAVIPGGYWRDKDTFEPILWSFYVNLQGHLCMQEHAYGQEDRTKAQHYNFGSQPDSVAIEQMIFNLLALSTKPTDLTFIQMKQVYGFAYLTLINKVFQKENDSLNTPKESSNTGAFFDNITFRRFKDALFVEAEGKPEQIAPSETTGRRHNYKEDPLKLIQETLRIQYSEAPFQDKVLFSLHILNNRITKILTALPQMNNEKKGIWISRLKHDIQSIERQVDKSGYEFDLESTMEAYHQHVNELKRAVADFEKSDLNFQKKRLKHLDHVISGPINLKIPFVEKEVKTLKVLSQRLQDADRSEINNLKTAFEASTDESIGVVEATLRTLSKRMDELVVDKNYELAIDLHRLLLPLIPPPPKITNTYNAIKKVFEYQVEEEPGFWKTLSNVDNKLKTDPQLFLKQRSDQLKSISDEIGKLSQYFWESKFRVHDFSLKPDELIFVLNVEAFLLQLIEKRKIVLEKAFELKFPLNSEEQNFLAINLKNLKLIHNNYRIIHTYFIHTNYFCLGENPEHYQFYQKIHMYYEWRGGSATEIDHLFSVNQKEVLRAQCREVLEKSKKDNTIVSDKEVNQLLSSYLYRPSQANEISIPSPFANFARNRWMVNSLLSKDPLDPRLDTVSLSKYLLAGYPDSKTRFKNALEKIKSYDRFEIGLVHYNELYKRVHGVYGGYEAGIVSESFKPGDNNLPVAFALRYRVNGKPIKDLLGHPRKDINKAFDVAVHEELNTESTKLNESISSDSTHPMEEYLLKTMQGRNVHQNPLTIITSTYQSIHEIFDDILQKPWILETLLMNEKSEESLESYKRMYGIIYIPYLIVEALEGSCEFFISHAAPLKCLLEKLREEKKTRQFTFLIYLTHTITHHIKDLIEKTKDDKLKKKLQELRLVWPDAEAKSSDVSPNYFEEGFTLWKKETNFIKKLDATTYLINTFVNDKHASIPGEIGALKNKETILQVMELGHLMSIGKNGVTIPVLGLRAFLWVKEYFSVYVDKLEVETREYVLNGLVSNQVGPVSATLQWNRVQDSPLKWEKEGTVVDLLTMQVLSYKKNEVKGFELLLPDEITHHSDYKLLFADQIFRATLTPGVKDTFKYEFTDVFGQVNRILYTRSTSAVVIERLIDSTDGKGGWVRFYHPELISKVHKIPGLGLFERYLKKIPGMDLIEKNFNIALSAKNKDKEYPSLESQLLASGLWVFLDRPKEALVYLGKNTGRESQVELQIKLDKKDHILSVRTKEGMEPVNDVENKLFQTLSCLHREQILFLKHPNAKDVSEIRFLNQEISLKRSQDNVWIINGDSQLEGATWVMGPDRGAQTNALFYGQGINIEEFGLTVRHRGQTVLLVWPHPLKLGQIRKNQVVEFEKQYHIHPPLKIRISDEGEVHSSSGGFLELAFHFAIKKDYTKAVRYLERARVSKIENKEELHMMKSIEMQFKGLPRTSARSSILYLKALLVLKQVYQEQTAGMDFSKDKWKNHLKDLQEINQAFISYETQLLRTPFELKARYFEKQESDVFLTKSELSEIKSIQKVILAPYLGNPVKIHLERLQLPVPSIADIGMILPFLLMSMEEPIKDSLNLQPVALTDEKFIQHFFEFYNLIIKEKITPDQLQPLFGPIMGLENAYLVGKELGLFAGLLSSEIRLDIARRMLIKVATDNIEGKEVHKAFDLSLLMKLRDQIPDNEYSFLFNAGMAGFKTWWARGNAQRTLNLDQSSETLLGKKLDEIKTQLYSATCNYAYMGLEGFSNEKKETPHNLDESIPGVSLDLNKFNQALKENKTLFGPLITALVADLLVKNNYIDGFIPFEKLIELVNAKLKVNLFEVLHEQEMKKRVQHYESEVEKLPKDIEFPSVDIQVQFDKKDLSHSAENDLLKTLWEAVTVRDQEKNIDGMFSDFEKILTNTQADPLEATANMRLLGGLKFSKDSLKSLLVNKCVISKKNLPVLFQAIYSHQTLCSKRLDSLREEIINYIKNNPKNLPEEVKKALKHFNDFGFAGIINILKQAYVNLTLEDSTIARLVTHYLLHQIAVGVMAGEVTSQMAILKKLDALGFDSQDKEWISASTRIRELTSRALSFDRYLNAEGRLVNPQLNRIALLTEAAQGIVLFQDQLELIQKIVDNPRDWYELKVGKGKTSIVYWIVLFLLAKKGTSYTALVKEELIHQNLDSLDRSSRTILEKAGVEFSFQLNDRISPVFLQDQYLRLLQVKSRYGFPILTINSLIAIDQKIQLYTEELKGKIHDLISHANIDQAQQEKILAFMQLDDSASIGAEELEDLKPHLKAIMDIENRQKELYYLAKIKQHFKHLIIDEPDDILNVISENNVGLGKKVNFEPAIQEAMLWIMELIFTSKESDIIKLKEALLSGQQAALKTRWIKSTLIPCLAKEVLANPDFKKDLGADNIDLNMFIGHLSKVYEEQEDAIELPPLSLQAKKKFGALKRILQVTLPIALSQQPGINVKVKNSDGFQVGPHQLGRELSNVVFSDEHDIVVNHDLGYGVHLPAPKLNQKSEDSFTVQGLMQIKDQHPAIYEGWVSRAKGKDLICYLNENENYKLRLEFLELYVFRERKINRYERQVIFNVQDICYGRVFGGMTGTLNRDCLPQPSKDFKEPLIKKVTGQVLLEAGILEIPKVMIIHENEMLAKLKDIAKNLEYKAIINQGYFLANGDAKQLVIELRKSAQNRSYVFVGTDDRKIYIWKSNEAEPELISKLELNKYAFDSSICFYFGPPDTRGTDFRMPSGKCLSLIYPRCTMDDFVQTLGRARGSGSIHSMDFLITKGIESRIQDRHLEKSINYALLIDDINQQDLQQQQGKNLKAAYQFLKMIVKMGTHHMLYGHHPALDDEIYHSKSSLRLLKIHMVDKLSKVANDPETGWMEQRREINLEQDFARSVYEETVKGLIGCYENELGKIKKLKSLLEKPEDLLKDPLSMLFLSKLDKASELWMLAFLRHWNKALETMQRDLDIALKSIQDKLSDEINQIFPRKIPSNGAAVPTEQAQVQEVQQQQEQQQQQQQNIEQQQLRVRGYGGIKFREYAYKDDPLNLLFDLFDGVPVPAEDPNKQNEKDLLKILDARNKPKILLPDKIIKPSVQLKAEEIKRYREFWVKSTSFKTTPNFNQIFTILGGFKGSLSSCRIGVQEKSIVLMTRGDFHSIRDYSNWGEIYTLLNPSIYKQSLVLNKTNKYPWIKDPEKFIKDPEVQLQVVQAKWFLGISDFTAEELILLKPWLKKVNAVAEDRLTHISFLKLFGTQEQVTKMDEWIK